MNGEQGGGEKSRFGFVGVKIKAIMNGMATAK